MKSICFDFAFKECMFVITFEAYMPAVAVGVNAGTKVLILAYNVQCVVCCGGYAHWSCGWWSFLFVVCEWYGLKFDHGCNAICVDQFICHYPIFNVSLSSSYDIWMMNQN